MARIRKQDGFSLIELMLVVVIAMVIAGFAVPAFLQALRNFRLGGDSLDINGEVLMAKMRAAARFTQTRVYFDLTARQFRSEFWDKTNKVWTPIGVGAPQNLSSGVDFGEGNQTQPPLSTQTAIGQAAGCMAGDNSGAGDPWGGSAISDTACIVFNSRGYPIDSALSPTPEDAIYINNEDAVHAVTVSSTGVTQTWRHDRQDTTQANWRRR